MTETASHASDARTGVVLVNVGTPDEPTPRAVRRYLREFLGDPRVVDIPAPMRWLLLNLFILPFRPAKSAAAYRKVWTEAGSPLTVHSEALRAALQNHLGDGYQVEVGMRYGNPSLSAVLERFLKDGVRELVVVPVYPQYASSSTGTSLEAVYGTLAKRWNVPAKAGVDQAPHTSPPMTVIFSRSILSAQTKSSTVSRPGSQFVTASVSFRQSRSMVT